MKTMFIQRANVSIQSFSERGRYVSVCLFGVFERKREKRGKGRVGSGEVGRTGVMFSTEKRKAFPPWLPMQSI